MPREKLRNGLIVVYMLGNVLTFNSLLKAEHGVMIAGEPWLPIVLKLLGLSLIWPLYWVTRLFI
jgi:hypothetical protein